MTEPMFPVEPRLTVVVARNQPSIEDWCRRQDPPIDPRSAELIRLTSYSDTDRLFGIRYVEGETRVVVLGWPLLTIDCEAILNTLTACGFPEEGIRP